LTESVVKQQIFMVIRVDSAVSILPRWGLPRSRKFFDVTGIFALKIAQVLLVCWLLLQCCCCRLVG